jgi:small multidrug resistance pump
MTRAGFETVSMKISNRYTRLAPTLFIFFFYGLSFTFLSISLRGRSAGVAGLQFSQEQVH